ncbi:MAG: hypothetical protein AAF383_22690 [Cyanobacteria bacterium P01_A01_bin.83]
MEQLVHRQYPQKTLTTCGTGAIAPSTEPFGSKPLSGRWRVSAVRSDACKPCLLCLCGRVAQSITQSDRTFQYIRRAIALIV